MHIKTKGKKMKSRYGILSRIISVFTIIAFIIMLEALYIPHIDLYAQDYDLEDFITTTPEGRIFKPEDIADEVTRANESASTRAEWEAIVLPRCNDMFEDWEADAAEEIDNIVNGITTPPDTPGLRSFEEYKAAVKVKLDMEKEYYKSQWDRECDEYIEDALNAFLAGVIDEKERVDNTEQDAAYEEAQLDLIEDYENEQYDPNDEDAHSIDHYTRAYYDGREIWEEREDFLFNSEDGQAGWEQRSADAIDQGLSEWGEAIGGLEEIKNTYLNEINDLIDNWYSNKTALYNAESTARWQLQEAINAIRTNINNASANGWGGALQMSQDKSDRADKISDIARLNNLLSAMQ